MMPTSSSTAELKEHLLDLECKTSYKAACKDGFMGNFKFPPTTLSITSHNSLDGNAITENRSTMEHGKLPTSSDDINLSRQAINTLESVIEHSFLESKKKVRDIINIIFSKATSKKIHYKAIYNIIEENINSGETSTAVSELIRNTEDEKYKKASQIILSIFLLVYAKKDIIENNKTLHGLINACMAYSILISPDEAGHIIKAISTLSSVNKNAKKGGEAKAKKRLPAIDKAIELVNEKRPNGGYKSRSTAIDIIENDLLEYIRIHMPNLKESNYKERTDEWFKKHPELQLALQLPPEKQKKRTSSKAVK